MVAPPTAAPTHLSDPSDADLERRFGGLRRLYGDAAYQGLRAARVAIVGLGGVGSWAGEALARCGVATLVLIDLDHVAESNINRQVQALGATLGQAKAAALQQRIADIHPGCVVHAVEEFADASNWPALLPCEVDVVIDACDQVHAKLAMAAWAVRGGHALVVTGAAGGKRMAHGLQVGDLADVTHDPLLASLRNRLRREHGAPRQGAIGVRCVYSRESVTRPVSEAPAGCDIGAPAEPVTSDLNCHGYGSSVTVTASFGMAAANEAIEFVARRMQPLGVPAKPDIIEGLPGC